MHKNTNKVKHNKRRYHMNKLNRKIILKFIRESIGTIVGACILAVSTSFFLLPNELSAGGFSGIATIAYYIFKIPMGRTILVLNIPLFLFSLYKIGKMFFIKSLIGTVSLSIFIDIFDKYPPLTNDKILACLYGGVLTGIGTAIILKYHSSTGGSDLITSLVKEYRPVSQMGSVITTMDFIIVALNVIFLRKIEIGLYSAITIYLMGKLIDIVFEGVYFTKLLIIISNKSDEISKGIQQEIRRGVTGLYGKGMYKNEEKMILICAVGRNDVGEVKQLVKEIDRKAFIIITNSREVVGRGFKD